MRVRLLNMPAQYLCETAAGMCYKAADGHKAMMHAVKCGHESVLEHCSFTFLIEDVSRVLLAQLTRHRIASYSVESQRYCGANMQYITPDTVAAAVDNEPLRKLFIETCEHVEALYNALIVEGVPAEDARYFTFQGGVTNLVLTMNGRELRHFFSLRCCNRAQWEIRQMADKMLTLCRAVAPDLFSDAGPGCVRGKCPEGKKSCGKPRKELAAHEPTE